MKIVSRLNKTAQRTCSTGILIGLAFFLLVSGNRAAFWNHQGDVNHFFSGANQQIVTGSFDRITFSRDEGKIHVFNMVKISHALKIVKSRIPAPESISQFAMEIRHADDFFREISGFVFQPIPLHLIHCIFRI